MTAQFTARTTGDRPEADVSVISLASGALCAKPQTRLFWD